ncbi:MAG: zinc ABC transporter substrate-binding protein, partial [Acidiferrobacterales bacterium]|nr:zinc ABC transporter substrate-binding protein [Acidiferrobacterales bacterium]
GEDEDHHGEEEDDHGRAEDEDEDHHGEEEDDHGRAEGEDEDHHGEEEDDHGEAEDEDHHGEEEEHAHGRYDMHIWLDVNNARVITEETAEQLAQLFPQHEAQLTANVKTTLEKLDLLETELRSLSESFLDSPYVVFHDAYQYLEKMLGLNNVGTVTVNPERSAGAKRLLELRETIRETGATCAFKEPQFNPSILEVLAEGTDLKIGTLDPLGADIEPGPDAYFELLRNMVVSLKDCLADAS